MSYLPYQPEIWPPEPVDEPRNRAKVIWWTCGVMLYLLLIVGWVYWMKLPPKPKPPIAMIPMPDGSELRLIHVRYGKEGIFTGSTFDGRLPESSAYPRSIAADNVGGLWLVFTNYRPQTKRFSAPDLLSVEIVEPESPYPLRPSRLDASNGPCLTVLFHAVPTASPTLPLRITRGNTTVNASILNPLYQARPASSVPQVDFAKPQPLPQQQTWAGFTASFEKVVFRHDAKPRQDQPVVKADAQVKLTHATAPPGSFYRSQTEWFDAGGNVVQNGVLPWSSLAWGVRFNVHEGDNFPVPSDRLFLLGTVKAPGPNQVVTVPVPPQLKRTYSDIFVVGAGSYSWSGRNLFPSGSSTPVATASGNVRYGSISESAWGIHLLAAGYDWRNDPSPPKVRVRKGDVICSAGSSGSSAWNNVRQYHYSTFRHPKSGNVPAGDEVTLEAFTPIVQRFEFFIPRPDYTPAPAK